MVRDGMIVRLGAFVGAAVAAVTLFTFVSGGEEQGRVALPVDIDIVDESGNEVGFSGYCYADAIVLFDGDRVDSVEELRGDSVREGERVERVTLEDSYGSVYRDDEGVLREGCRPDSQDSFVPADEAE